MRAIFVTDIGSYPYDTQKTEIIISSTDYSGNKVLITTKRWNQLNGVDVGDVKTGRNGFRTF